MNDLIEIENINKSCFDYKKLDDSTSTELQSIANSISIIVENTKYSIGEQLFKAQELLAKRGYGCFNEWIESYNLSRQTAYNYINYYKVFVQQLDKQEELKKLSDRKIYALGRLNNEQQSRILENVDLGKKTNKEVEEITKQLKEEQEYSEELQQAIREKEQKIKVLQNELDNIQIPEKEIVEKEIVKEVVPEHLIKEKENLKQCIVEQQEQLETLRKRAEKAESTLRGIKLEDNLEKDAVFDTAKLDMLLYNIRDFLKKNSQYTYLKEELQNIPSKKKKFVQQGVNSIKEWTMLMEQALENRQDVVGNIIYGEGEIINE